MLSRWYSSRVLTSYSIPTKSVSDCLHLTVWKALEVTCILAAFVASSLYCARRVLRWVFSAANLRAEVAWGI